MPYSARFSKVFFVLFFCCAFLGSIEASERYYVEASEPFVETSTSILETYESSESSVNFTEDPSKSPANFTEAKRLAKIIHHDHRVTFYCGCVYDKHNKVNLSSCGYPIQKDKRRAERLEWEHIVPVSLWGQALPCWREALCCNKKSCYKGRNCCRKQDPKFAKMEADLHNLVPEIGELNGLRSNYRFGVLPHLEPGQFGNCTMKIDSEIRRVEPPNEVKGWIARAYLYMSERYEIALSKSQQQLFLAWNKEFPPTMWETERDNRIAEIQGNHNPWISEYTIKVGHHLRQEPGKDRIK